MCEAGRIKHHLKHNIWKPENTILFVGYQATNTLGRALVDGVHRIKLFGESYNVGAEIKQLPGVSGHADVHGLLDWATAIEGVKKFFINHGESESAEAFGKTLREELGADVYVPYSGAEFDLISGKVTIDAKPVLIPKKENAGSNNNIYYKELLAATDRLSALIKDSQGRANADMRKLADKINKLCDKWEL